MNEWPIQNVLEIKPMQNIEIPSIRIEQQYEVSLIWKMRWDPLKWTHWTCPEFCV